MKYPDTPLVQFPRGFKVNVQHGVGIVASYEPPIRITLAGDGSLGDRLHRPVAATLEEIAKKTLFPYLQEGGKGYHPYDQKNYAAIVPAGPSKIEVLSLFHAHQSLTQPAQGWIDIHFLSPQKFKRPEEGKKLSTVVSAVMYGYVGLGNLHKPPVSEVGTYKSPFEDLKKELQDVSPRVLRALLYQTSVQDLRAKAPNLVRYSVDLKYPAAAHIQVYDPTPSRMERAIQAAETLDEFLVKHRKTVLKASKLLDEVIKIQDAASSLDRDFEEMRESYQYYRKDNRRLPPKLATSKRILRKPLEQTCQQLYQEADALLKPLQKNMPRDILEHASKKGYRGQQALLRQRSLDRQQASIRLKQSFDEERMWEIAQIKTYAQRYLQEKGFGKAGEQQ